MAFYATRCGSCGAIVCDTYYYNARVVCRECKVKNCSEAFLNAPLKHKWSECDPASKIYFVHRLGRFYAALETHSMAEIVGKPVVDAYAISHWEELLAFADYEETHHDFSPIDFSLVRFERYFKDMPETMDAWLTLCAAYDLGNYLCDIARDAERKKK